MQSDQYESVATISELTGLKKVTLCNWIKKEKVQAKRIGQHPHRRWMINLDSLNRYLDQHLGKSQRGKKINISISVPPEILPEQYDHHIVLKAQHQMKFVLSDEPNAAEQMDREEMLRLVIDTLNGWKDSYDKFVNHGPHRLRSYEECCLFDRLCKYYEYYEIICMYYGINGFRKMCFREISETLWKGFRSIETTRKLYLKGLACLREDMLQHL